MELQCLNSPFDKEFTFELLDENCQPVEVSSLADVQINLKMQNCVKLSYKKVAATGWLAWTQGEDGTSVVCLITEAQSNGWRGLLVAEVQQVVENADFDGGVQYTAPKKQILFLVKKSGFTTYTPPVINPITFTPAFACDPEQNLQFSCIIIAPASNYIIQIKIKEEWRRLYKGYLPMPDGGTETYGPITIPPGEQIAAGDYYIRVLDAVSGATSEEVPFYLPDCTEGKRDRRYWQIAGDGFWDEFNPYGWY